jgi:hypothetical protein
MKRFGINLGLVLIAIAAAAGGCAPEDGPLIGSDARDMEMYMIDDATDVTVSLPFHARLHAGEPGQVRIEGEDNLIALIAVEDFGAGRIEISAPADLGEIQQNQPIDLFIPYADMTRLQMDGADIMLWDDPRYMPELWD